MSPSSVLEYLVRSERRDIWWIGLGVKGVNQRGCGNTYNM